MSASILPVPHPALTASANLADWGPLLALEDLEQLLRVHRRTIRRWVAEQNFPRPLRPGGHRPRWRTVDTRGYLEGLNPTPAGQEPTLPEPSTTPKPAGRARRTTARNYDASSPSVAG